jgi:hypothetical protein
VRIRTLPGCKKGGGKTRTQLRFAFVLNPAHNHVRTLAKQDAQAAVIAAKQIEGGASVVPAAAQTVDLAHAPSVQS